MLLTLMNVTMVDLHYNTGRRINNGFIRLGHIVYLTLSDRDIVSYYRSKSITDIRWIYKSKLNEKLIRSYI